MATHQVGRDTSLSIVDRDDGKTEVSHVELTMGFTTEEAHFLSSFPEPAKKRLLRKLDLRLPPMLAFLYLMAYLDRANIGNAKIEGLVEDLNMTGAQYNIALTLFFVPYILLEIPSNTILIMFKKPSTYMGTIVVLWGIVMTLTGVVRNFGDLMACRVLLGVFEAGFFPAAIYLISQWYLPGETQVRIAIFYTASALSGAFSGLLAFAIAKLDGVAGVAGWRWIFILEGIASVLTGVATFFFLVDTPELSSGWLTPNEIKYLRFRQEALKGNSRRAKEAEKSRKWEILKSTLCDWQIYLQALVYWSNTAPNYGMKFSMPQIIKDMGFSRSKAQLMTIPPYFIGAISAYVSSYFSDRFRWRMPFIVAGQAILVISFIILFVLSDKAESNIGTCYFAVLLACVGFYPINPGGNAWTAENLAGPTKKAQGLAFLAALGNIGGIIGSNIYIDSEAPRYPTGYGASFGFAGLGILCCLVLEYCYWRINKKRAAMSEDEIRGKYTDDELNQLGDRSLLFKYSL